MSGKQRGSGWKREMLDKIFGNRKLVILSALAVAVIGYVLFLIFGDIHASADALYRPVLMGVMAFCAAVLVLGVLRINPSCTPNAMDWFELFFAAASGVGLVVWMVLFGIRALFSAEACAAATVIAEVAGIWCAICLIHNSRK